ncbi:MAG: DUF7146 domain-containing protein [Thermus sp.]|uniref:DUF7146 domain-containing protein n=1 Tax=Thermus sp. TaxID=275 RepID=UPI003D11BE49
MMSWLTANSTLDPGAVLERILEATRARRTGPRSWLGLCPAHADRTPSLSIREAEDGRVLVHCFAGCPTEAVLEALGLPWAALFPGGETYRPLPLAPRPRPEPKPDEGRRRALEALWARGIPLDRPGAEIARRYLEARGLSLEALLPGLQNLRLHPGLEYREGEEARVFPALLARVEHPRHGLVALHRTYLAPDGRGKAPVEAPKKLTRAVLEGGLRGAAIRLYAPGEALAVAEGVETALAVREITGLPAWSAVSAGGLEAWAPPPGVREVLVAADGDERGVSAGKKLARRLSALGIGVRLAVPPPGADWLDVLAAQKRAGAARARPGVMEVEERNGGVYAQKPA